MMACFYVQREHVREGCRRFSPDDAFFFFSPASGKSCVFEIRSLASSLLLFRRRSRGGQRDSSRSPRRRRSRSTPFCPKREIGEERENESRADLSFLIVFPHRHRFFSTSSLSLFSLFPQPLLRAALAYSPPISPRHSLHSGTGSPRHGFSTSALDDAAANQTPPSTSAARPPGGHASAPAKSLHRDAGCSPETTASAAAATPPLKTPPPGTTSVAPGRPGIPWSSVRGCAEILAGEKNPPR